MEREQRRIELKDLMGAYDLTRRDVARLCGVSRWTVKAWLAPPTNRCARRMRLAMLELLRLKLAKKNSHGPKKKS